MLLKNEWDENKKNLSFSKLFKLIGAFLQGKKSYKILHVQVPNQIIFFN